jgi:hypothetical protein
MIGIDKVRPLPTTSPNSRIGLAPHILWLRPDDTVLSMRLVPDGRHVYTCRLCLGNRRQLRLTLMTEPIPDSK